MAPLKIQEDGRYLWPTGSGSGLPFVSDSPRAPTLKQQEVESLNIEQKCRVEILDTSKPDDLEEYRRVVGLVAKGWAAISQEERQFIPENKGWLIFLRWVEYFETTPDVSQNRVRTNHKGQISVI